MTVFAKLTDAQYADMMETLNDLQEGIFCNAGNDREYTLRIRAYQLTDGTIDWLLERKTDGTEYWPEAGTEPEGEIEDQSTALMTMSSAPSTFPEDFEEDERGLLVFAGSRKPATADRIMEEYDLDALKINDLDPFIAYF